MLVPLSLVRELRIITRDFVMQFLSLRGLVGLILFRADLFFFWGSRKVVYAEICELQWGSSLAVEAILIELGYFTVTDKLWEGENRGCSSYCKMLCNGAEMLYVSPIVSLLLDPIVPELACTCPRVLLSTNLSLSLFFHDWSLGFNSLVKWVREQKLSLFCWFTATFCNCRTLAF